MEKNLKLNIFIFIFIFIFFVHASIVKQERWSVVVGEQLESFDSVSGTTIE